MIRCSLNKRHRIFKPIIKIITGYWLASLVNKSDIYMRPILYSLRKYLHILIWLFILTSSCTDEKENFWAFADALCGSWQLENSANTEYWSKKSPDFYSGILYSIEGNDTIVFEKMSLKKIGENIYFIAEVSDQNNQEPIRFLLNGSSSKALEFENADHDFPNKIVYRMTSEDRLEASIIGLTNNKPDTIFFNYSRIKQNSKESRE